jgi:hypothetical protein
MFRVLKVGGWAWLQVPIDPRGMTREDPGITAAGFSFVVERFVRTDLSAAQLKRFGLYPQQSLLIGTRDGL